MCPLPLAEIDSGFLRGMPLPDHEDDGGKQGRGQVLVVGGARQTPGAVLLAGVAALRAGAGKLQLATVEGAAHGLAVAVPEALVIGLRETKEGAIDPGSIRDIADNIRQADAILVGSGCLDEAATGRVLAAVVDAMEGATLIVDAGAIAALGKQPDVLAPLAGRAAVIPNEDEMGDLDASPGPEGVMRVAQRLHAVVACRGEDTWVAAPDAAVAVERHGSIGLAMSGSGDVVGGVITGLAARGASPFVATVWGVHVHARAGADLSRQVGPVGFLARQLLDEVPRLLAELDSSNPG